MSAPTDQRRSVLSRWKRHRGAAVITGALVIATAAAVITGGGARYDADLDPGNADPSGARAVARVLSDQGIEVEIVRDAESFGSARIDGTTTILITSTEELGRSTVAQVLDRDPDRLVLAAPRLSITGFFSIPDGVSYAGTRTPDGTCSPIGPGSLRIETREGTAYPVGPGSCFLTEDGALLTRPSSAITVLGAADVLRNDQITRAENAALALRLLGQRPRLLWYVPDVADLAGTEQVSLTSLLPRWLGPGLLLGAVAVLALIGWRGRRLGPLVTEPLPAVVTAIETTLSRGRLYRKAADRAYAAAALRRNARRELSQHLRLPRHQGHRDPDPRILVDALLGHSVLPATSLLLLLDPNSPAPRSDRELVALANDLATLTREVCHP